MDVGWEYSKTLDHLTKKVKCNCCDKIVSCVHRLKQHIGHIKGNVLGCNKVPEELHIKMKDHFLRKLDLNKKRVSLKDEKDHFI